MLTVKQLVDDGVLTASMADILFTRDEARQRILLSYQNTMLATYRVCALYTALLQAYTVSRAIQDGCTVHELAAHRGLAGMTKRIWDSSNAAPTDKAYVFTMLSKTVMAGDPRLEKPDFRERLETFQRLYTDWQNPRLHFDPTAMSSKDLTEFMAALPLLANTVFDDDRGTLIFSDPIDNTRMEITAFPFLCFLDMDPTEDADTTDGGISTQITDSFMVLVSAQPNESKDALLFDLRLLEPYSSKVKKRTLLQKGNEGLRALCDAVGVPTDWYTVNDGKCDLVFLENLTQITRQVLPSFWEKHSKSRDLNRDCQPKLQALFNGSEIASELRTNRRVKPDELEQVFYELFIKCGMFKTMRALFLDTKNQPPYGDELFSDYLDELSKRGYLKTDGSREKFIRLYQDNAELHENKLGAIVNRESEQYRLRARMIRAEWRAFSVLSAMGLKLDNLITDEETIHSIDDYYDMIQNDRAHTADRLREVLLMLIALYDSLLHTSPENEELFAKSLRHCYRSNRDKELCSLLDDFGDVADRSVGHSAIAKYLGRHEICDRDILHSFLESLANNLETAPGTHHDTCSQRRVFISYAHEDAAEVEALVKKLRTRLGRSYDVFFDTQLHGGQDWRSIVRTVIDDPNCVAVVLFSSPYAIASEAVLYEMEHTKAVAKQRNLRLNQMLIPVNLDIRPIEEYIKAAEHPASKPRTVAEEEEIDRQVKLAVSFHEFLHHNIFYRTREDFYRLESDIQTMAEKSEQIFDVTQNRPYNDLELAIANFYTFLKLGVTPPTEDDDGVWVQETAKLDEKFKTSPPSGRSCVFPLVVSVKETKIKRDNITLTGYEIIGGKGETGRGTNYILSSRKLGTNEDYYCLPNRKKTGDGCSWMVEPLLIPHKLFTAATEEDA